MSAMLALKCFFYCIFLDQNVKIEKWKNVELFINLKKFILQHTIFFRYAGTTNNKILKHSPMIFVCNYMNKKCNLDEWAFFYVIIQEE